MFQRFANGAVMTLITDCYVAPKNKEIKMESDSDILLTGIHLLAMSSHSATITADFVSRSR